MSINYNFGQYNLSSTTSYKKDRDLRLGDYDYSTMKIFHSLLDVTYKNIAQEIKLTSKTQNLTWLAGLYLDKSKSTGGNIVDSIYPSVVASNYRNDTNDNSLGVFAHGDYKITDKLSLLGGLRYDKDKKEITDKKN